MRSLVVLAILFGGLVRASATDTPATPPVYRYETPPPGFRPLTASDQELARYGLPPRPGFSANAAAPYAMWSRAMAAARYPVTANVVHTGRRHIRAIVVSAAKTHQAGVMTSTNWAGQTLLNPVGSFGPSSYGEVSGQWSISAVQQAIGTCGGTDVSATWVGIDGAGGSNDVMQAGTESDASCFSGYYQPNYYAWFEWYPGDEYELTNFPISPGEAILVVVRANSATTATAIFVNLQSNQYAVIGFTAPAGTSLTGSSAEWIVERPSVNNVLGHLADYGIVWMSSEIAFLNSGLNNNIYDTAASGGPGRTPYTLTMVDSSGNALSTTGPNGLSAQTVSVTGSAY